MEGEGEGIDIILRLTNFSSSRGAHPPHEVRELPEVEDRLVGAVSLYIERGSGREGELELEVGGGVGVELCASRERELLPWLWEGSVGPYIYMGSFIAVGSTIARAASAVAAHIDI